MKFPIYTNLKLAREDFQYTLRGLADLLKIDPSTISKYEKGIRGLPVELVRPMAEILECSYGFIMQESDYGLFAYYNDKKVVLSIEQYNNIKESNLISITNNKRVISSDIDSSLIQPYMYKFDSN